MYQPFIVPSESYGLTRSLVPADLNKENKTSLTMNLTLTIVHRTKKTNNITLGMTLHVVMLFGNLNVTQHNKQ